MEHAVVRRESVRELKPGAVNVSDGLNLTRQNAFLPLSCLRFVAFARSTVTI